MSKWGEETSTVDFSADGFDAHQAFAEIHWPIFLVRGGRQEINLDGDRILWEQVH